MSTTSNCGPRRLIPGLMAELCADITSLSLLAQRLERHYSLLTSVLDSCDRNCPCSTSETKSQPRTLETVYADVCLIAQRRMLERIERQRLLDSLKSVLGLSGSPTLLALQPCEKPSSETTSTSLFSSS